MDDNTYRTLLMVCICATIVLCSFAKSLRMRTKKEIYVDKTWRGFNIEHFSFTNKDESTTIFVIFSGLKDRLEGNEILEIEMEMQDLGIIPMFPKKDMNDQPTLYLIDRNNGYKYRYCGYYAKVKIERCK